MIYRDIARALAIACVMPDLVHACSSATPPSLRFMVERADLVIFGTLAVGDPPSLSAGGQSSEHWSIAVDVQGSLFGEGSPALVFYTSEAGVVDRIERNPSHESYVVALAQARGLEAVSSDPTYYLLSTSCGPYIFPMGDPGYSSGQFVFEIYDGDGDPMEEAAVFDRLQRGSGLF